MMWGIRNENGIWLSSKSRYRFLFKGHDALYVALWKLRIRFMKLNWSY